MKLTSQFNYSKPTFYEHSFGMLMQERSYSSPAYRYGFNGKENDNEVNGDGNEQDYGFRIYDTRLGRFLSVDIEFKKYPEISSFNFAANNPIRYIDVNGAGPGDVFASMDDAAKDFGNTYNDNSIELNRDFGSYIYKVVINGETKYKYTVPNVGKDAQVKPNKGGIKKSDRVAILHTHGAYNKDYDQSNNTGKKAKARGTKDNNNEFSEDDEYTAKKQKMVSYLATPGGELKKFDPAKHKAEEYDLISKGLPSDNNGNPKTRANTNDYTKYPKDEPTNDKKPAEEKPK